MKNTAPDSLLRVIQFSPLNWEEIAANGFRKTSGAMSRSLRESSHVRRLWFVQHDRRWGFSVQRKVIDEKVEIIALPIGLPFERFPLVRAFNRLIQARMLAKLLNLRKDISHTVYWFYDWLNIDLIQNLPPAISVMELTDSAEQFNAQSPSMLTRLPGLKDNVRSLCSYVFAVSTALAEEAKGGNCRVEVLSNGIGEDFLELAKRPHEEPNELRGLGHPRLLVVGTQWSLNYRVDHQLLLQVLDELGEWQLIIVGCERAESKGMKELASHRRVNLVGMRRQEHLVAFIHHVDVCGVPYLPTPQLRDPLKTYEYLACGKPVVLTADRVTADLEPYVRYAQSPTAFSRACKELLAVSPEQQQRVRNVLRTKTWAKRAERCLQLITTPNG